MRILLIDDDSAARLLLARFLRRSGFEVVAQAANGAEALRLLQTLHPPDLIITDCQMPRMDGLTLLRLIRRSGNPTPVIMLSGQSSPQVIATVLRTDHTAYLIKPFSPDRLLAAIDRLADLPALAYPAA
jgi:two-component system, chemotaxis family, chemotaxis protein CheY